MKTNRKILALAKNIREGLLGYMMYEGHIGTSPVYSEYLLYTPILRLVRNLSFHVRGEVATDKVNHKRGDFKRLDFVFEHQPKELSTNTKTQKARNKPVETVYCEVKFVAKSPNRMRLKNDIRKIAEELKAHKSPSESYGLLIVAHLLKSKAISKQPHLDKRWDIDRYLKSYKIAQLSPLEITGVRWAVTTVLFQHSNVRLNTK